MVYNSQKGRGINDLFGTLNRAFTPVLESVADVGANVATGLVSDLLSGKGPKDFYKRTWKPSKNYGCPTCIRKSFRAEAGQSVNEAVQKVNPRRNVNRREVFIPLYIILPGIILVTIG